VEEIEANPEQAQEDMHHHASHGGEPWIARVALTSALIAAFAAVSSMLAAHHANEANILQLRASDKWNEYQAKKQKSLTVAKSNEVLEKLAALIGGEKAAAATLVSDEDREYLKRHTEEEKELMSEARDFEAESKQHMHRHHPLAMAVTMFQVAIAVSAIAVLSKRPPFWYVSLGFGMAGLVFLAWGLWFVGGHAA
jgi:hypothetical protein